MFDLFYAMNIMKGWKTFEDVPEVAREGVKKQLELYGYGHLAK